MQEQISKTEKEIKKNGDTTGELTEKYKIQSAQLKALKLSQKENSNASRMLQKMVLDESKAWHANEGSLNQMRKQLSVLKAQYADLSETDREDIKNGGEKLEQMSLLNAKLKELEKAYGDNQREVGNYALAGKELKTELKDLKNEMIALAAEGKKKAAFHNAALL